MIPAPHFLPIAWHFLNRPMEDKADAQIIRMRSPRGFKLRIQNRY